MAYLGNDTIRTYLHASFFPMADAADRVSDGMIEQQEKMAKRAASAQKKAAKEAAKRQEKAMANAAKIQGKESRKTLEKQYELENPWRREEFDFKKGESAAERAARLNEWQGELGQRQTEFNLDFNRELGETLGWYQGQKTQRRHEFDSELGQRQSEFDREFGQRQLEFGQEFGLDTRRVALQEELGRGELGLQTRAQTESEAMGLHRRGIETGGLTGYYNGQLTEEARGRRMQEGMSLAEIMGEYRDPITGQRLGQTEGRRTALEAEALRRGSQSGYMERYDPATGQYTTGALTEEARAQRIQEAQRMMEMTGEVGTIDPQTGQIVAGSGGGKLTDAAQQWRAGAALDYARTAAALQARPGDYFESAAYMRGADASGVPAFLRQMNDTGGGSGMAFRAASAGTPSTGSMQQIAGGVARVQQPQGVGVPMHEGLGGDMGEAIITKHGNGPAQIAPGTTRNTGVGMTEGPDAGYGGGGGSNLPASLQAAQAAHAGQPAAYTSMMNQQMPQGIAAAQGAAGGQAANPVPVALGGNGGTGIPGQGMDLAQQRLAAFQPTFQAGAHKLGPGAMEGLGATERQLFGSALNASGINPEDWEQSYNRSRIQTNTNARMA